MFKAKVIVSRVTHLSTLESLEESLLIDNSTTSSVNEAATLLHRVELLLSKELGRVGVERNVERDDIGLLEELIESLAVGDGSLGL